MLQTWNHLRRDRRGATAVLFGVSAVVVVGMVGLGTEGGSWYVARRDAQNAADFAAYAGARRLAMAQQSLGLTLAAAQIQARDAAIDAGSLNGFTISPPTTPYAGDSTAVRVDIRVVRPRLISRLFLASDPTIGVHAVANSISTGPACAISSPRFGSMSTTLPPVTGQLIVSGSGTVTAGNCILASNSDLMNAISATGNGKFTATSLTAVGGCVGCPPPGSLTSANVTLSQPAATGAAPTPIPAAVTAADARVSYLSTYTNCYQSPVYRLTDGSAINPSPLGKNPNVNSPLGQSVYIPPPPAGQALCGLFVNSNDTVVLSPGLYVFYNSDLRMNSGKLECRRISPPPSAGLAIGDNYPNTPFVPNANYPICSGTGSEGVTIVFTGTVGSIGKVDISASATLRLAAPSIGTWSVSGNVGSGSWSGILFYRDYRNISPGASNQPAVTMSGNANTVLAGAMYFPNSYTKYSGNSSTSGTGSSTQPCSLLFGGTLEFTGNSSLSYSGCVARGYGGLVPNLSYVRLSE